MSRPVLGQCFVHHVHSGHLLSINAAVYWIYLNRPDLGQCFVHHVHSGHLLSVLLCIGYI